MMTRSWCGMGASVGGGRPQAARRGPRSTGRGPAPSWTRAPSEAGSATEEGVDRWAGGRERTRSWWRCTGPGRRAVAAGGSWLRAAAGWTSDGSRWRGRRSCGGRAVRRRRTSRRCRSGSTQLAALSARLEALASGVRRPRRGARCRRGGQGARGGGRRRRRDAVRVAVRSRGADRDGGAGDGPRRRGTRGRRPPRRERSPGAGPPRVRGPDDVGVLAPWLRLEGEAVAAVGPGGAWGEALALDALAAHLRAAAGLYAELERGGGGGARRGGGGGRPRGAGRLARRPATRQGRGGGRGRGRGRGRHPSWCVRSRRPSRDRSCRARRVPGRVPGSPTSSRPARAWTADACGC